MSTTTAKLGLVKADPTENVDVTQLNANWDAVDAGFSGIAPSFRNAIRNGDAGIAQRGNGPFTTSAACTADGWKLITVGGSSTVTRVTAGPGTLESRYYMSNTVAGQAAAGDVSVYSFNIEGVEKYAGKQVTFSLRAWGTSGTPKIAVECQQDFAAGTGGSAFVNTAVQAITLSTTPTTYSVTFTVPSISGKTIGTGGTDYLAILVYMSAGSSFAARASNIGIQNVTINMTDVQLELGAVATAFERLPQQVQLAWCQRYYFRKGVGNTPSFCTFAVGAWNLTTNLLARMDFPVQMRAIPSGNNSGTQFAAYTGGTINLTSLTLTEITVHGVTFGCVVASGGVIGQGGFLIGTTAGTWVDFSAEL